MTVGGLWAVVEIMGHRTRAGLCSDAQIAGSTFLRIEHPSATDHTGTEPLTEYYAPSSIFAVRPCSFDEATRAAGTCWPRAVAPAALPASLDDVVDLDDDDQFAS